MWLVSVAGHGLTYNVMAGHQITVVTNGAGGEREGNIRFTELP